MAASPDKKYLYPMLEGPLFDVAGKFFENVTNPDTGNKTDVLRIWKFNVETKQFEASLDRRRGSPHRAGQAGGSACMRGASAVPGRRTLELAPLLCSGAACRRGGCTHAVLISVQRLAVDASREGGAHACAQAPATHFEPRHH
jgi:hypothetical protein